MQIKALKNDVVEVSDSNSKVLLATAKVAAPAAEKGTILAGLFEDESGEANVLNRPGEYEYDNIEVINLEGKKQNDGVANLFKLVVENVHLVFFDGDVEDLGKQEWDLIGETHVLILNLKDKQEDVSKAISKFAPHRIVVLHAESKEAIEKVVGIPANDEESKLKFSSKEFNVEEPIVQVYLL